MLSPPNSTSDHAKTSDGRPPWSTPFDGLTTDRTIKIAKAHGAALRNLTYRFFKICAGGVQRGLFSVVRRGVFYMLTKMSVAKDLGAVAAT